MPVYNGQTYLHEAIESILNQTFTDFEFIIINDGSTDETVTILKTYTDSRIVLVQNDKNSGLIASLNKGIALAKSELIARMDADDIALPDRLANQFNYLKQHPHCKVIGGDHNNLHHGKITKVSNRYTSGQLKSILLFATCFIHPSVLFKKTEFTFYNSEFLHVEDYELWTRLALQSELGHCEQPLIIYRSHSNQISQLNKAKQLESSARIRENYLKSLGFQFTEKELQTHNLIGNNAFIKNESVLIDIENWLKSLVKQNEKINTIPINDFNGIIHKFWLDSCGNTALGLKAYRRFIKSSLSSLKSINTSTTLLLAIKCLIRKFKR